MITLQEHIAKIQRLSDELARADTPVRLAAGSAIARFAERVFVKGESITGGKFQYNDTTPLYANPLKTFGDTADLKPPTGKTGKKVFKSTGKAHLTTWVKSYKELRKLVKRESSFVNWTATNDLKSELSNRSLIKVGEADYKMAVNSDENSGKLQGLIVKYPGVFELSEAEKQAYYKTFDLEFKKLLREKLNS